MQLIIIIVVMVAMMFFMNRKQKAQQQQRIDELNRMTKGDAIVTIGGLHGLLHEVDEANGTITLDCEGVFLVFDRNSIKTVTSNSSSAVATADEDAIDEESTNED
ncbi:MAG: preprotein translocase subunit YajC [Streptococcaceae bacterium]|jgi:preprotein translocase subunit YajC|nr:preprotein translocase subunit YajC [Streptococcaceae bacterium]